MKIIWLLVAAVLLTAAQAMPLRSPYVGRWHIIRIVGTGEVTGSDRDGHEPIGKTLSITSRSMSLAGAPCVSIRPPTQIRRDVDDVLRDEQMLRRDVQLNGDALAPSADFIDGGCLSAIATRKGRLVVFGPAGYAYLAVRNPSR